MTTNSLQSRFGAVARKVKADFEASAHTQHHGSRRTEREEIFAKFLALYVPGRVQAVHNAEIITATGDVSPQCDVVIVDRNAPRLRDLQSHRVVPAECVYGVIEVKSRLDSKELLDSCAKIAKVKKLVRTAYVLRLATPSGLVPVTLPRASVPVPPIFGYVFAFEGIQLKTLGNTLLKWCTKNPRNEHLDAAWIAESGMIVWGPGDGVGNWFPVIRYPERDREMRLLGQMPEREGDVLLGLIMGVSSALIEPLPPFGLNEYFSGGLWYSAGGRSSLPK
jgi:hypothetical protein